MQSDPSLHKTICAHVRRFHNIPQSISNLLDRFNILRGVAEKDCAAGINGHNLKAAARSTWATYAAMPKFPFGIPCANLSSVGDTSCTDGVSHARTLELRESQRQSVETAPGGDWCRGAR